MPNEPINHGQPYRHRETTASDGLPIGYVTDAYPGGDPPAGWSVVHEPSLHVRWDLQEARRVGHVQVSLDLDRFDVLRTAAEVERDEAITKRGTYTGSLDGAELNHLIPTLKRATPHAAPRSRPRAARGPPRRAARPRPPQGWAPPRREAETTELEAHMTTRSKLDPVFTDRDGLAIIGRTRHDPMGIRYQGETSGNTPPAPPAGGDPTPPAPTDPAPQPRDRECPLLLLFPVVAGIWAAFTLRQQS